VLILLAPWVLLFLFLLEEHIRGKVSLARYKQELIAKGEKLSLRDFISQQSQSENGAPEIIAAMKDLKKGRILPFSGPPRAKVTTAGRAIVCFRESEWVELNPTNRWDELEKQTNRWDEVAAGWVWQTNHWDELAAELESNHAALDRMRVSLGKPVLDNQVDLSQWLKTPVSTLVEAKILHSWFGAANQLALHEGRIPDATEALLAQTRLLRLVAGDRTLIGELVRLGTLGPVRASIWETLQADGWTDRDLARLQRAWEDENFAEYTLMALERERVYMDAYYAFFRETNECAAHYVFNVHPPWARSDGKIPVTGTASNFLKEHVYCRAWRFAWLDQDERNTLDLIQRLLEVARSAVAQKSFAAIHSPVDLLSAEERRETFYDRLRFSHLVYGLPGMVGKCMRAETERSVIICAIALKRCLLRHGNYPTSLDSLVPEFLTAVPPDYMDGKPIKYHLNSDGTFTLYSVGDDGNDDGGDPTPLPKHPSNTIPLWYRKDFVWPAPALPDEIEVYRKEMQKN